jgi:hypothetical protein
LATRKFATNSNPLDQRAWLLAIGRLRVEYDAALIFSIIRRSNAADIVALRIARLPDRDEHVGGDDTERQPAG